MPPSESATITASESSGSRPSDTSISTWCAAWHHRCIGRCCSTGYGAVMPATCTTGTVSMARIRHSRSRSLPRPVGWLGRRRCVCRTYQTTRYLGCAPAPALQHPMVMAICQRQPALPLAAASVLRRGPPGAQRVDCTSPSSPAERSPPSGVTAAEERPAARCLRLTTRNRCWAVALSVVRVPMLRRPGPLQRSRHP